MNKEFLYSPWRMKYITSEKEKQCIFCIGDSSVSEMEQTDRDPLIVYRSIYCFVILNLYPYNNGHIMVVPNRHLGDFSGLKKEELHDLFETVQICEKVLKNVYKPDGINIGMNLGKAAGAGIDEHLHVHLVPRWSGDVNFMTSIADTRVIPDDFINSYKILKEGFDNVTH